MISAKVIGTQETIARLNRIAPNMREELKKTIDRLAFRLWNKVKAQKLSGQVLKVRTGNLRGGINKSPVRSSGDRIFASVGTNSVYGRAWEMGFSRRLGANTRGGRNFTPSYLAKHPVGTKQYAPRSFLRSSLAEMTQQIKDEITMSVKKVGQK